ncbi:hypothetical protein MKX03_023682 [Papaver bracteatum]|nr:hypothetical protein MKX03_023682 [Papaver bracteatum]
MGTTDTYTNSKKTDDDDDVVTQAERRNKELGFLKRQWEFRDALTVGLKILEHTAVCFAPFYFTWDAFWVSVVLYVITLHLGISLSYHRNLTHRSFKLPQWLEYFFAYCGLHAAQGDPMFWASVHRYHHQYTDSDRDPHTPNEGFWFSHINWVFYYSYVCEKCGDPTSNVMDLYKQPFYRFIQKTYLLHLIGLGVIMYMLGGWPYVLWGMGVRITLGHHSTFMVNSVCHTWGSRPWNTKDLSKNNWVLGLIGYGENWHNNHHAFQNSARLGLEWWQLDFPWYVVKSLECMGLATDVKVPTELQKQKMSFKNSTTTTNGGFEEPNENGNGNGKTY